MSVILKSFLAQPTLWKAASPSTHYSLSILCDFSWKQLFQRDKMDSPVASSPNGGPIAWVQRSASPGQKVVATSTASGRLLHVMSVSFIPYNALA